MVTPERDGKNDTLFFDGSCGLCHRTVRFVVSADKRATFQFAPIGGEFFTGSFGEEDRTRFPDSFIVLTADGRALTRSEAALYVGRQLGGVWKGLALFCAAIPLAMADSVYDFIASIRYRLFSRPSDACPIVPKELRSRFLN